MQAALDAFNKSIGRVRALHSIYISLSLHLTSAVDLSDVLRAELVMAVSAFDFYIHELCRLGILESHKGLRPKTAAMGKFQVPISALNQLTQASTAEAALDAIIREKHGYLTFQRPDSVADAIRLFSTVELWKEVATHCGETPQITKSALQLIIDRRNQIAHEADVDPSYPDQLWPIDVALVEGAIARIETVAKAIFAVAV